MGEKISPSRGTIVSLTEAFGLLALIVAAGGYYETRRNNNIQERQAKALEELNRIAAVSGGQAMPETPSAVPAPGFNRWPALTLLVLLLMNLGVTGFDYFDRHYGTNWVVKSVTKADLDKPLTQIIDKTYENETV